MSSSISVCAIPEPTNYSREDSTDESRLRWYYNYTSVAMRFVVDTVSDEAIQLLFCCCCFFFAGSHWTFSAHC
ncbi:hypothetical protein NECAME_18336 [Necator americanus]|uniref:Uncharacterized protein n=1 Tax=Necator americanus TaxID=51031 RepID=W2SUY9_NECAM|nr:hypothetical protein NECAME_18336 [Necator americanus]ETN73445.1 hypothetical protein NECAME_18336 [Necator americanus]